LQKQRFYRIISEIKKGIVNSKKDRDDVFSLAKDFWEIEDEFKYFLTFDEKFPKINNKETFEKFVEKYLGCKFEEYKEFETKKELAKIFKDTKAKNLHTSNITIIHRKRDKLPQIFYEDYEPKTNGKIVVVENYESFLKIDFNLFKEEDFIYLGGYSNKKTAQFLKDKEILFFGDFDFFGIKIFNSITAKSKKFFIPNNLEETFKKYPNKELYLNQKYIDKYLDYSCCEEVYNLIKKYSACVEQEIYNK